MSREKIQPGDLIWVVPCHTPGMGNDLVLIHEGSTPSEIMRVPGDQKILCIFLRRQRIDISLDRAMLSIVLYDGSEYTVLIGAMKKCN